MSRTLEEKIAAAWNVIKNLNYAELENGRHEIDEDSYFMVQTYEPKSAEGGKFEAHEKYVDIQYLIEGTECIYVAPTTALEIQEAYKEEIDAAFYKCPKRATKIVLTAGGYVVLYPEDAHQPGVKTEESTVVKKIVGKVRV